jgi:hypothetical protein
VRPVSNNFLQALRGSHSRVYEAFVVEPGQTGVEPTGTAVSVLDGDVRLDLNAAIRSHVDLMLEGTGLFPDSADDSLAPYGNEIFVRIGLVFSSGSIEYVSQGYFRILDTVQSWAPDGPILINAQDRMAGILEARLLNPVQFASSRTYGSVVEELVEAVYPWATIEWDDSTDTSTLGRAMIAEEDRYTFLNDLITSLSKIWYWDHRGILVIKDAPPQDESVWDVNAGQNGVLINLGREISREGVYNAVKASGEDTGTTAPVSAVAYDNNPDSPTYYNGGFGKVPYFMASPFIKTVAQARSAAQAQLKKNLGLPYQIEFTALSNPALEPYDAVEVNMTGVPSRTETHVVESLIIPLSPDRAMAATTREQTTILIGDA